MAQVQPFGALRFTAKAGELSELVCPPYDIVGEEERESLLQGNPHNLIRLELPLEGENPYDEAASVLENWLTQGLLACDPAPAFYIYEEVFTALGEKKRIKGLVCRVTLEEFEKGVVLPHEETLSKAKEDRFQLMRATGCNFSSIYSLYFDEKREIASRIDALSEPAPDQEFTTADGILHRLWTVTDPADLSTISAAFVEKVLYIADGHHRYETALRFRNHLHGQGVALEADHPANSILMTLVPMEHPGLVVFPTHRIVRGLSSFDPNTLLESCQAYFTLSPVNGYPRLQAALDDAMARGEKAFGFYTGGSYTLLTLRESADTVMSPLLPQASAAYRQLDVNILHLLILERLLGIDKENMANQKNLIYTRDPAEALEQVDAGQADCAFFINPTRVDEIASVSQAGEKMPQKSTYFYPKLITGHVMNRLL